MSQASTFPIIYKVRGIEKDTLSVMAKPGSGGWIANGFLGLWRLGIHKILCLVKLSE